MPVNVSNSISEPRCAPPRPIVPDPTISAEKAYELTKRNIRANVFEKIREAIKLRSYSIAIENDLPDSLIEELKKLGYKVEFSNFFNEYVIDWSKDD